jgi:[acyl-carrier-protein] S-malonyltransferase
MPELAFIFPGQGSQQVGMGLELVRAYPTARATFDEADSVLDRKLSQLCFEGPAEALRQTENTQLAVLTCSIAALRVVQELGITPRVALGHSLGEYSALVAANMLGFREALKLVQYRSRFMAEASGRQICAMAAILGLDANTLNDFCAEAQSVGVVQVANYNCPGQLIISGDAAAVKKVVERGKETVGAKRCRLLPVSGAFHSALMEPASVRLQSVIGEFEFQPPQTEFVANVTADYVPSPGEIRQLLIDQVISPVQWEKSIRLIGDSGVSHFVELGPGKVLCGMVRRILDNAICLSVEDGKSLEKTVESINSN